MILLTCPCTALLLTTGALGCSPATHSQGKPQAIARIRRQYPYNNVVMIGDGISGEGLPSLLCQ